jgi:hypothetical protein
VELPPRTPTVINAFLEGCRNCDTALAGWRDRDGAALLEAGIPVVNVALGAVSLDWAKSWMLDANLVVDVGGRTVFGPADVDGFETLVVDERGAVRLRDRPGSPGFVDRVRGAVTALQRPH